MLGWGGREQGWAVRCGFGEERLGRYNLRCDLSYVTRLSWEGAPEPFLGRGLRSGVGLGLRIVGAAKVLMSGAQGSGDGQEAATELG